MEKLELEKIWSYLHANPEVSWEEYNTTKYLMLHFQKAGFNPIPFETITGFYVEVGHGHPKVGVRADMDALLQKVDGEVRANHSCGHDAHMTIVTGVMQQLKEKESNLKGTVRAIFQPAEELGNGAVKVVETGITDDLDYLFGVHVRPKNEISFPQCAPSIQHGACVFIRGEIKGVDHHGARPHEGVNAIEVGHAIMQHLNHMHINPQVPSSVKMTKFHSGNDHLNIIPGKAAFGLDMRAQTNGAMNKMKEELDRIMKVISELYNVTIEYMFDDDVPAAVIDAKAEEIMRAAILSKLGKNNAHSRLVTSGSDDFHYYTLMRPHIKATMLALGANVEPGLHHPQMTFEKKAMQNGVNVLVDACLRILKAK